MTARRSLQAIAVAVAMGGGVSRTAQAQQPPTVVLEPPSGWIALPVEQPDLSLTRQVTVRTWTAWGPVGTTDVRLVAACLSAAADTWTPEAEPLALEKIAQSATSTALRVAGIGALRATAIRRGEIVSQRLEGTGDAVGAVLANSFLAFAPHEIIGCFALCVDPHRGLACAASVEHATVTGTFSAPPSPSASLRILLAAVHRPGIAGGALATLALAGAVLTLATRKRPRRGG